MVNLLTIPIIRINELKLIIIDLNDVEYGDINFIKGIVKKNNNIDLIGYMENINGCKINFLFILNLL